jgi:squalene synthase HpnC
MPVSAPPSPSLDPRTPPIDLLRLIGPEWERASPELITPTLDESIAYCRGLATSHYENFSVLSSLIPLHLRDDFAAVYAFCRWSDDLGDETGNTPEARTRSERLLTWWRDELDSCFRGMGLPAHVSGASPEVSLSESNNHNGQLRAPTHPVYIALRATAARHPHLTAKPFEDLIAAFVQDQKLGTPEFPYETWEQLLDYCLRSANPVGRIVLTLGGYAPPDIDPSNTDRYAMSDATCTALQLINFWQDVRRDLLDRDRVYIPTRGPGGTPTGITRERLREWLDQSNDPRARVPYIRGLRPLVEETAALFVKGRPLPTTLDGGIGPVVWLFGAGGHAILRAVRGLGCATLWDRPRLAASEKALLVGRAWLRTKFGRGKSG